MTSTTVCTPTTSLWFVRLRPKIQASLRLYCFPHAGGGANTFYGWPASLPPTVEICAIQLPGRGSRIMEEPFTQMAPLVQALARELLPHLDKPFAFYGHSTGALVSFELARELRRQYGLEPVHLFAAGSVAPQIPDPHPMHHLPDSELICELRRLGGLSKEILENSEVLQLLLPTIRADCAVSETYCYTKETPLSCPVSVFGGLQDSTVNRAQLENWRAETSASFSLLMLRAITSLHTHLKVCFFRPSHENCNSM